MARSVVTGGFGFVGSHVVERLLRGGGEVTVLDIAPCPDDLETGSGTLRVVRGDVRDPDAVAAAVSGGADVIYHLAAVVGVDRYLLRPLDVIDVNVLGTRAVLGAAAAADVKVVVASTSEIYGKNPQVPWAEDTDRVLGSTAADRWCYSSSKAVAEHMTYAFARKTGLPTCILRYFNLYGPRQRRAFVLSRTIHRLLQQLPPQVFDSGQQTRCFTYVADAAEATVLAGISDAAVGQCFNVGSGQESAVAEAVALVASLMGVGTAPVALDTERVLGPGYEDILRRVPDVRHIEQTLGWRARTSLEEGLRRTIEWARHSDWSGLLATEGSRGDV